MNAILRDIDQENRSAQLAELHASFQSLLSSLGIHLVMSKGRLRGERYWEVCDLLSQTLVTSDRLGELIRQEPGATGE